MVANGEGIADEQLQSWSYRWHIRCDRALDYHWLAAADMVGGLLMRVHLPSRSYRVYAFVTEQVELERAPQWIVDGAKRRLVLFTTVYAGIYGFSDVDKRDAFVRQCNTSVKMREIAHVCSPFSVTVKED